LRDGGGDSIPELDDALPSLFALSHKFKMLKVYSRTCEQGKVIINMKDLIVYGFLLPPEKL